MTTAHRPTWNPARGAEEQGTFRLHAPSSKTSSKDAPAHQVLKTRPVKNKQETFLDLRQSLNHKEEDVLRKKTHSVREFQSHQVEGSESPSLNNRADDIAFGLHKKNEEAIEGTKVRKVIHQHDKDDSDESVKSNKPRSTSDISDSDDSDVEERALLAELETLRREKEQKRERERREDPFSNEKNKNCNEASLFDNPLLAVGESSSSGNSDCSASFTMKRRWEDDTIFRKQATGERKVTQRLVNDTLRSDFHRNFMRKYVR